jgi:AraC-like DNA-binding protein
MSEFNRLQKELAELTSRHIFSDGYLSTKIPCLGFSRYSSFHYSTLAGPPYGLHNPSIGFVVQGSKNVILGDNRFTYGSSHYFVVSIDLPIIIEALEASPDAPNLSCKIEFTPSMILELISVEELKAVPKKKTKRGLYAAELDITMLDAVVRLVRLLDKSEDIPVLAPLYTKEILYKALHGETGDSLRQIVADGGATLYIKNAIQYIIRHFQESLRVEELADIADMSVATFHRHFKQITSMTPIQFQKQLRLQEGRRLIISEAANVAEASFRVGYESPTQFSREYSRAFGLPPKGDMKRLK